MDFSPVLDYGKEVIHRAYRFVLKPTAEQEAQLLGIAGATRLVYNLALNQRLNHWRQYRAATGRHITWVSQDKELTELRAQFPFIAQYPREPMTAALRDLERAYAAFFRGTARIPKFRCKGKSETMRFRGRDVFVKPLNRRWALVRLPKVGLVKCRYTRGIRGVIDNATVALSGGVWTVSFSCAIEHAVPANDNPAVGIDRGIAQTVALSTGEMFKLPERLADLEKRARRAARKMSRRQRGSKRHLKARRRLAAARAAAARLRSDWQHRLSRHLAERFSLVGIESLNVAGMTRSGPGKRGLNRSILEQSWTAFANMLAYKLEERGGALVFVDPRYTSQTCSDCGAVDSRSRESQASFVCTACGFRAHADTNAAINILRRSAPAMPAEGCGYAPGEAGTSLKAA